ncbi:methyltransferase family protein [Bermanella sp. WJH001]|uniref:methyltransferase family protein n=1 Tax=Bermanella sp. WJH001 TaxID=3048005 RepID=UPI0024BE9C34|nr:isoprenylcysteine carboxylmethyltransferase family protein [Bermanella sp. WJH001]MDJ1538637.1 isoprenylcysteine carboxylmethyltransferase family protein [Bermanella sp. WJH001]
MLNKLELLLPPLPLTFVFAGLMWAMDTLIPLHTSFAGQSIIASFFLALGLIFIVPAALSFFKEKTTVDPRTPEKSNKLVVTGLYNISRNPMYVGMFFCLLALSVAQGNILSVLISISFVLYLTRFQIKPEERFLTKKFGDQYLQYCAQVRRWL